MKSDLVGTLVKNKSRIGRIRAVDTWFGDGNPVLIVGVQPVEGGSCQYCDSKDFEFLLCGVDGCQKNATFYGNTFVLCQRHESFYNSGQLKERVYKHRLAGKEKA